MLGVKPDRPRSRQLTVLLGLVGWVGELVVRGGLNFPGEKEAKGIEIRDIWASGSWDGKWELGFSGQ